MFVDKVMSPTSPSTQSRDDGACSGGAVVHNTLLSWSLYAGVEMSAPGRGDAGSLKARRTLVNERYHFFYRGDDKSVCLVSEIDI
jgi:hypothetical protein